MSEIGRERVEPMAQIAERLGSEVLRERGSRSRRQPSAIVLQDPNPEPAERLEPPHQVDSLA